MKKQIDSKSKRLATGLAGLLGDTYTLYNTTQNCHWNVEGSDFVALHGLFEQQYGEMAGAIDLIAERIRVLGFYTPGTLEEVHSASRLTQEKHLRKSEKMLDHLIQGHQQVAHRIHELLPVAEKAADEATLDLLIERLRVHQKAAWMLRSQANRGSEKLEATGPSVASASA